MQVGPPYWHHGIYVSDSEIIEFGGSKPQVCVRARLLAEFGNGDPVEEVKHPVSWMGQTYSPLLPPDQVIDRARWMLHNQPPPYQLGYRNCESIGVWCATGDFESFQVKEILGWKSLAVLPTVALIRRRPALGRWVGLASIGISLLTAVPYIHSRALFDHTRGYPGIGNWSGPE
jgi:Lecithin retinol acyltransferase